MRLHPFEIDPHFYKCPKCGKEQGKPMGEEKARPIMRCKGCKETVKMEMRKRELCVPCAVKLAETNDVKKTGHRKEKITCSECQRRRYGAEYEVSQKAEKGARHDTIPE